ncbi:DUF4221 domain-containing protein [Algoriphagus kandeliae]|uniref:DUF4221 domain-containing protein n=1 Tax=Algoriphagus kandeliae TaxID=2562278 RepID=A0A4Y9QSL5_9BACT|nr:DUF4221 family protein [Algoriphagus kandeliae]TFV94702.1 DUF4221 domain-containing protein [Algoriphagus kandeliae]
MRNPLFLFLAGIVFFLACSEKASETPNKPLSDQNLKFEIYDSLMVDYLGNLMLMDISPNGENYLLIDQNTDTIFVTDPKGKIKHKYYRSGDDPESIQGNRTGLGKFLDNESILIPGSQGIITYELSGKLKKAFKPDFTGLSSFVVPFNQVHWVSGQKVYVYLPGRYSDLGQQGLDFQKKSKRLEILDLNTGEFSSVMPFPKSSKFSSETQEFGGLDFYPTFTISGDSLYMIYRNEPKIFAYTLSNLEIPASVKTIPYPEFIERKADSKPANGGFNFRDFFLGFNLSIFPTETGDFLLQYLSGLTDEEANEVTSAAETDFNKMFEDAEKYNSGGFILFDGKSISPLIVKPEILGTLSKYVSNDEIWFSLNFEEAENDYSVIYKTRLVTQ